MLLESVTPTVQCDWKVSLDPRELLVPNQGQETLYLMLLAWVKGTIDVPNSLYDRDSDDTLNGPQQLLNQIT